MVKRKASIEWRGECQDNESNHGILGFMISKERKDTKSKFTLDLQEKRFLKEPS